MDDRIHDDDLRALRANDPGAGARAPQELRERVDGIPSERMPVRRGWLVVAAAVVVAGVIGAGFAFAPRSGVETVALTTPAPGEIAPPIMTGADGAAAGASGPARGGAGESRLTSGAAEGRMPSADGFLGGGYGGGYWGRQRFTVPAFDDSRGEATVYALDGASRFSAETLAGIAASLGVAGEPVAEEHGGGWRVGAADYSGPQVSLAPWSGGQVWYSSGDSGPFWRCVDAARAENPESDGDAVQEGCLAATPPATEDQAREGMSTFLRVLGVDEDAVRVEIDHDGKDFERTLTASASYVVEDMAVPAQFSVTVSSEGLVWASGSIGGLVSLGSYDIVSPAEAAERLNTSAFSPDLTYTPPVDTDPGMWEPLTEPAPVPEAGSPVPWPIAEREIVSARLGLTTVYDPDSLVYVIPAYEFTDAEGNRWSVIALAEDELDTAATLW